MVCEFKDKCNLYKPTSFTCHTTPKYPLDDGRYYCGKARRFALEKQYLNAVIDGEMLFQQTVKMKK